MYAKKLIIYKKYIIFVQSTQQKTTMDWSCCRFFAVCHLFCHR